MQATKTGFKLVCLAVVAVVGATGTGCDTGDASKAGGSEPPLTLRLVTAEQPNQPAAPAIKEFARQVRHVSDGRIRVTIEWEDSSRSWDQRAARKVVGGEFDLGWIPARAWDTEGVTSLRALHAPFLIDHDALTHEVTRGDLGGEMMRGLEKADVVGLALIPEGLRHPVGFRKPLLGPADYEGAVFRAPRSHTSYALIRALGAIPADLASEGIIRGVRSESLRGADSSYQLVSTLPPPAIFTGNVTLYPKVNTLVANADTYDGLTSEQRQLLNQAADRTVDSVRAEAVDDGVAAERLCRAGGAVVNAVPADVRALKRAARPVYAELAEDRATAAMIEQIRALKQQSGDTAAPAPDPCALREPAQESRSSDRDQSIPNGVYRASLSKAELVKAGLPEDENYHGVHTLTLEDGRVTDSTQADYETLPCHGSYRSADQTISITWLGPDCSGGLTASWSLRDDLLRFTQIRGIPATDTPFVGPVFGRKPFRKID
jgi:TRAP-type C4-dicarboxylate transport system substrate-binding protein